MKFNTGSGAPSDFDELMNESHHTVCKENKRLNLNTSLPAAAAAASFLEDKSKFGTGMYLLYYVIMQTKFLFGLILLWKQRGKLAFFTGLNMAKSHLL